jgi:twitching motility protein PilT
MQPSSRRVGEFLVERKVLARDLLEAAMIEEAETGVSLAKILITKNLVAERDLLAAVAAEAEVRFWDFQVSAAHSSLDRLIPVGLARRHRAVAVAREADELLVAMEDPSDAEAIEAIAVATGFKVVPALAVRDDLLRVVAAMYGPAEVDDHPGIAFDDQLTAELHINNILETMVRLGASDLHLSVGVPPCVRIDGTMTPLRQLPVMNGSEIRRMVYAILTQKQRERFEGELELDTSHVVPNLGRFRLNVFLQRDALGAVFRAIPYLIPSLEELGLPAAVVNLATLPRGLVLLTGPTGSGKSTTLASVVDLVNTNRALHIMTVEDPIEFIHSHKRSVVNQREVGEDTLSFANALKHVLRQDPDVILVGELRDLETISMALTAAETGHLVFGTLHTLDAPQSIDRIIDVFPGHQQQQIRVQLASALQCVVTQQLVPRLGGKGRVAAIEVLMATPAIRNLIREGKTHQIYSAMQAGAKWGMQTMDQSLAILVQNGQIALSTAGECCANEQDLRRLISAV